MLEAGLGQVILMSASYGGLEGTASTRGRSLHESAEPWPIEFYLPSLSLRVQSLVHLLRVLLPCYQ